MRLVTAAWKKFKNAGQELPLYPFKHTTDVISCDSHGLGHKYLSLIISTGRSFSASCCLIWRVHVVEQTLQRRGQRGTQTQFTLKATWERQSTCKRGARQRGLTAGLQAFFYLLAWLNKSVSFWLEMSHGYMLICLIPFYPAIEVSFLLLILCLLYQNSGMYVCASSMSHSKWNRCKQTKALRTLNCMLIATFYSKPINAKRLILLSDSSFIRRHVSCNILLRTPKADYKGAHKWDTLSFQSW